MNHLTTAWFLGDVPRAKFAVQVSDDTRGWREVFAGRSGGTRQRLEKVYFKDVKTRHVRVVCRGNSDHAWSSITELAVYCEHRSPTRLPGR